MINSRLQQSVRQLRFPESEIEAKHKFVNIFLKISMRHSMEGSGQKTLEIADDNMNLRKPFIHFLRRGDLGFGMMRFAQNSQSFGQILIKKTCLPDLASRYETQVFGLRSSSNASR